jgi:hypothetical protein
VIVETKEQSKQLMHTRSSDNPEKFKRTFSVCQKAMAAVFWGRKGVLMVEFMQKGTTITSEGHCETLKKLRKATQNKRRGMLISGVRIVPLLISARPHTAACTRALLEHFNWELFDSLTSLRTTTTCLPTYRSGLDNRA